MQYHSEAPSLSLRSCYSLEITAQVQALEQEIWKLVGEKDFSLNQDFKKFSYFYLTLNLGEQMKNIQLYNPIIRERLKARPHTKLQFRKKAMSGLSKKVVPWRNFSINNTDMKSTKSPSKLSTINCKYSSKEEVGRY